MSHLTVFGSHCSNAASVAPWRQGLEQFVGDFHGFWGIIVREHLQ